MLVFLLAVLLAAPVAAADYDLVIRNARVVDGTGNPWFRADVAVKGGKIAAVGRLPHATATNVVDAAGRVLAPGFIDVHTHVEGALETLPRAENYIRDGVTTVVTGNCGSSSASLSQYFAKLDALPLGPNVASLVGHNTVRAQVLGSVNRLATPSELARMEALVDQAMRDGAVGFSTGLIYVPGTYADTAEVVALAKAASRHGGVYASHMRDEGAHVIEAITEAVTVGREAGMPVQLSHFKIDNRHLWGKSDESLALVERFRREGVDVVIDQYPYDRSSTTLSITLPSWALAGGATALRERLAAPETRQRIVSEMARMLADKGHDSYEYAMVARFPQDTTREGKTILAITRERVKEPTVADQIDTILEMVRDGTRVQMVYHSMGEVDMERILRYPHTAIASDGGVVTLGGGMPHPRSYGTNARVLGLYVREKKVLALEDAIRRMTSLPARTFGFQDRGLLREGFAADLVLFDPEKVRDMATFQKPHAYSEGFDHVWVNGVPVITAGTLTANHAGRVLRRGGASASVAQLRTRATERHSAAVRPAPRRSLVRRGAR